MYTILFVCSGNTCRSSMAEALARKIIAEKGMEGEVTVLSAGTDALPGARASAGAVEALKEEGVDLGAHRAQRLTPQLIDRADLILTMTLAHKQRVVDMLPAAGRKTFTLKEFAGGADTGKILEELTSLASRLEAKEREFLSRHEEEIERLNKRARELKEQLLRVEEELAQIQTKMEEETAGEWETIKEKERELEEQDIADPIGKPLEVYRECARELKENIEKALQKIPR